MPLHMIASLMEDALGFLKCSRRKSAKPSQIKKKSGSDYDTDDTSKSTEPGDHNYTDFSDWSDHWAGTDGSDAEVLHGRRSSGQHPLPAWPCASMGPPPGLAINAPPGLEGPPGWGGGAMQDYLQSQGCQGTRLNPQAKFFVPSFAPPAPEAPTSQKKSAQLRQSIRLLKQSLEQWEASSLCDPQNPNEPIEDHAMAALREALNKLSPQDAAMVKAFLDAKVGQPAPMGFGALDLNQWLHHGHFPGPQFPSQQSFAKPASRWAGRGPMQQSQQYAARPRGERSGRVAKNDPQSKTVTSDSSESLSKHLLELSMIDNARVLMLRKINHLGMDPTAALEAYFSKFGTIDRVMVSATRSKSTHGTASCRLRPATVGFLVMSDAAAVDAALACGEQHSVEGVNIVVSLFQSHSIDNKD